MIPIMHYTELTEDFSMHHYADFANRVTNDIHPPLVPVLLKVYSSLGPVQ